MQETIREAVEKALETLSIPAPLYSVEHPGDMSHGDYATNVALIVAKTLGKNPREVAADIVKELSGKIPDIEKIEIAGAGFINFHLAPTFFRAALGTALALGVGWGKNKRLLGKKVMVEYTSPNLFKPLHIGNLMSNIVGESIARLFEAAGAEVKRVNYPSDIGLSVAKAVWGLLETKGDPKDILAIGKAYQVGSTAYDEDETAKTSIDAINKKLYSGDDPVLNDLRRVGIATSKEHLAELCKILGTEFDIEIPESESGPRGKQIVLEHMDDGIFTNSDGAIIFRGEDIGLHTRVFINSQGLPTYEAKDIGLIALKHAAYPFDLSLTTTAVEQAEYFKVIIKAIERVFPELLGKVEHVPYGFLTLTTGKMSSRKGNVITGEAFIDEMREKVLTKIEGRDLEASREDIATAVGVAAIKFMVLKQGTGKNIIFDPEASISFEGDSGPYLQYTHARIVSVIKKAKAENIHESVELAPESPYEIEKMLYRFPEVVELALFDREPHYVVTYLVELASAFNSFYAQERIADPLDPLAPYKLALTGAIRLTLRNGLDVLGIKAPEEM